MEINLQNGYKMLGVTESAHEFVYNTCKTHMSRGHNYILNLMPYHKWGIGIGYESFVQSRKGQGEAKLN